MEQFGLSLLEKLKPCIFRYDDEQLPELGDKKHFGFIAQDLVQLFPLDEYGVVVLNPRNEKLMVNYSEFIALLTKWQQQILTKIRVQEERLQKLEQELSKLKGV